MFRRDPTQPQPAPVQVPDTPAEAVMLAALNDLRHDLRLEICRHPVGSGTRERLTEYLSRLSDTLIISEVPR